MIPRLALLDSARDRRDVDKIARLYRLARVPTVCFVGVAVISICKVYRLAALTSLSSFVPTAQGLHPEAPGQNPETRLIKTGDGSMKFVGWVVTKLR